MTRERQALTLAAKVVAVAFLMLTGLFALMKWEGLTSAGWWIVAAPLGALILAEIPLGLVLVLYSLTPEEELQ